MSDQIPQGGSYRAVRSANDGGEVHHIPAYSAYSQSGLPRLSKKDGPALWMTAEDHSKTASWRNSKEARDYRKQQKELIDQGRFQDAQQMDVEDIRSKFGDKYDAGLREAKDYTDEQVDPNVFVSDTKQPSPQDTKDQLKGDYGQNGEDEAPLSETERTDDSETTHT